MIDQVTVGVAVGGDAEAAERERRTLGHHAFGLEAGGDRNVEGVGQGRNDVARASLDATVAGDDHRRLRRPQQVGEFRCRRAVAGCHAAGDMHRVEHAVVDPLFLHVVGDRQQHRSRLAPQQRLRGLVQHLAQIVGALDQLVIARDAGEQRTLIDGAAFARAFLQAAFAENIGRGFTGDRQHRQPLGVGIRNPGNQIGRAGTGGGDAGRRSVRHARIAARHEGCALLVLDQYALHAGIAQAIVDRQHVCAGHTEKGVDAQALQIPDEQFADRNIHTDF